ncbi:MAG: hypothetical protein CM15mP117_00040 [Alphaproteobacteria bacterium]|nr:MAG: hypothetical protein CM15mP117_00040 [Alphaproteobacteria bacterium]
MILVNEPTRGVDVGARAEILSGHFKNSKKGETPIVIASTDLQEKCKSANKNPCVLSRSLKCPGNWVRRYPGEKIL